MLRRIPSEFICPISLQVMENPVTASCGHTFNEAHILQWLEKKDTCPIDREPLTKENLHENKELAERITPVIHFLDLENTPKEKERSLLDRIFEIFSGPFCACCRRNSNRVVHYDPLIVPDD